MSETKENLMIELKIIQNQKNSYVKLQDYEKASSLREKEREVLTKIMEYPKSIFLGGTCNNSKWRDELIPKLKIDFYNPVVENWTPECEQEEIFQRKIANYNLYVLTPKMTGFFSIAELVEDSIKDPQRTILCVLTEDGDDKFTEHQIKSLIAVTKLVLKYHIKICKTLDEIAEYVNN